MAGTPSRLGALIKRDPELAKREIFEIAREVGGHRGKLAAELGVSPATLYRAERRLGIVSEIDGIALDAAIGG